MMGERGFLQAAGKLLLMIMMLAGLSACWEMGNQGDGTPAPTNTAAITATARTAASTPTIVPPATPTREATPTIKLSPTAASTSTPELVTGVEITVAAANLRSGPSIEAEITGFVEAEEVPELVEISEDGQWYRVRKEDGRIGWVGSSVARIVEREVYSAEEGGQETPEAEDTPTAAAESEESDNTESEG